MNECADCIKINRVPRCWVAAPDHVCCDCSLKTPEDRQRQMLSLQQACDWMQRTLRDRFAEAALAGLLARADIEVTGPKNTAWIVSMALQYADEAMRQRNAEKSEP